MDTISLKKYIYENNKIESILNEIGCHHIVYHQNRDYYSCGNVNGDNPASINVKNNTFLDVINWTRQKEFDGASDIITLVQYNKGLDFIGALKYLHQILDLPFDFKKKEVVEKKHNPLSVFTNVLKGNRRIVDVNNIEVLDDELLDCYVPLLHIDWFRDGITERTRQKFGLAYSYKYSRVIIPLRYWLTGELLGFNQRTTVENYEQLGIRKYLISPTYPKQLNLYGLYENYDAIQKAGYVCVYESERSVLKRDSLMDSSGVALSGHSLSDEQVSILIKLNVEIVFCLDKDIAINEVRHQCNKFYNIRNVSYIYDKWDLLKDKESPADASNKTYQFLFKHRIKFDENEYRLYQESLKK